MENNVYDVSKLPRIVWSTFARVQTDIQWCGGVFVNQASPLSPSEFSKERLYLRQYVRNRPLDYLFRIGPAPPV